VEGLKKWSWCGGRVRAGGRFAIMVAIRHLGCRHATLTELGLGFDLICNAQRRVSTRPSHAPWVLERYCEFGIASCRRGHGRGAGGCGGNRLGVPRWSVKEGSHERARRGGPQALRERGKGGGPIGAAREGTGAGRPARKGWAMKARPRGRGHRWPGRHTPMCVTNRIKPRRNVCHNLT
jgi:hypothetical protein